MNLLGRGQQKTPQKRNPPITSPRVPFLHPRIPVDVLWFRFECTPLAGLTSKLDRLGSSSSSSIRSKPYICNCNFGTIHHLPLLPSVFVSITSAKKSIGYWWFHTNSLICLSLAKNPVLLSTSVLGNARMQVTGNHHQSTTTHSVENLIQASLKTDLPE